MVGLFTALKLEAVNEKTTALQITSLESQVQRSADKITLLEKIIDKQVPFWFQILLGFIGGIGALLLDRFFKLYDEKKIRKRILSNLFFEIKENYGRLLNWQSKSNFRKFLTPQFQYFEEVKNTHFDFEYPYMQDIFYTYKDWINKYNILYLKSADSHIDVKEGVSFKTPFDFIYLRLVFICVKAMIVSAWLNSGNFKSYSPASKKIFSDITNLLEDKSFRKREGKVEGYEKQLLSVETAYKGILKMSKLKE
jgi:hypothetical protein